jgi:transposase-like protein
MPAPKKYPDELRARATRMAVEARKDPAAATGSIKRIADQLGVHPEALRTWVKRAEIDAGDRVRGVRGLAVPLRVPRPPQTVPPHDHRAHQTHGVSCLTRIRIGPAECSSSPTSTVSTPITRSVDRDTSITRGDWSTHRRQPGRTRSHPDDRSSWRRFPSL